MKNLLILLTALALTACGGVPVARHFPAVPSELVVACPDLKTISDTTDKLSDVISVVTINYSQYHECKIKVDLWIDWYNSQQKIFDSVK